MTDMKPQPVTDDGKRFSAVTMSETGGRLQLRFCLVPLHGDERIARPAMGLVI